MSGKKHRAKKPQDQDLSTFEFRTTGLDLEQTKDLITTFDGYRIHRCFDLTFIEKRIGEGQLPKSFIKQWRFIRTILHKFAAVSPKIPDVLKYYERRQMLRYIATFLMVIAVPSIVATYVFSLVAIAPITLSITAFAVLFFIAQWTLGHHYNRKIAWMIEEYWEEHPSLLREEKKALKDWVRKLIVNARFRMRKEEESPEDNPIKFYTKDYDGVVVQAEPNWYRKHYVMHIKMDKD